MSALPEETRDLLTLQLIPGLGPLRITALLEHFGSPGAILAASAEQLAGVQGIGSPHTFAGELRGTGRGYRRQGRVDHGEHAGQDNQPGRRGKQGGGGH